MHAESGHDLRPRGIGEILDLTFQIYRERFSLFASLGVVVGMFRLLISLVWTLVLFQNMDFPYEFDPDRIGELLGVMLIGIPLILAAFLLVSAFGAIAMTAATEDAFLGRAGSLRSVVNRTWSRLPQAAFVSLLTSVLSFVGMCLCCLPGIVAVIVLVLAVPLVYLERASILGSLSRSWDLVVRRGPTDLSAHSSWVRILVVGFIMFLAYTILSFLGQLPATALSLASMFGSRQPLITPLGPQPAPLAVMLPLHVLAAAIQGLFIPFLVIPWTLIYYDIRTRYEGLDLEQAAAKLGGGSSGPPPGGSSSGATHEPPPPHAPPPSHRPDEGSPSPSEEPNL